MPRCTMHGVWPIRSESPPANSVPARQGGMARGEDSTMKATTIGTTGDETTAWHAIAADDVVRRLSTNNETGVDPAEIPKRLANYGPNRLPEAARRGPFLRFLLQFNNVLVYVLLAAAFVKLMMNLWLDAAIILGVVVINALLGFIQEGRAEKALDSIRNMLSAEARTVRGG